MSFQNNPTVKDESGEQTIKRYVHQPLTIEHFGLHAQIKENGRVIIQGLPVKNNIGDVEFDEIDVPASLIFKLAQALKMTRSVEFADVRVKK